MSCDSAVRSPGYLDTSKTLLKKSFSRASFGVIPPYSLSSPFFAVTIFASTTLHTHVHVVFLSLSVCPVTHFRWIVVMETTGARPISTVANIAVYCAGMVQGQEKFASSAPRNLHSPDGVDCYIHAYSHIHNHTQFRFVGLNNGFDTCTALALRPATLAYFQTRIALQTLVGWCSQVV